MPEDVKTFSFVYPNDELRLDSQQTPGTRIREAREAKEMTQVALAEAIGVHSVSISEWERDVYRPGKANWEKLSAALGVPRRELEHGFGASAQETFNAGIREGFRRAVDAINRLGREVVTELPIVPVEPVSNGSKKRRAR